MTRGRWALAVAVSLVAALLLLTRGGGREASSVPLPNTEPAGDSTGLTAARAPQGPTLARSVAHDSAAGAAHSAVPVVVRVLWRDDGAPVPGLALAVTDAVRPYAESHPVAGTTGADGRARLALPPGPHVVMATREACVAITVRADEPAEHTLRLPRHGTLHGRVVDEDGVPLAGARVALARGSLAGEATLATTAADGTFAARLPSTLAFVFAEMRGHGRSQPLQVRGMDAEEPPVELVLARATTTVRGVVTDDANRPIAGARVGVGFSPPPARPSGYSEPVRPPALTTDAHGRFTAEDIPPGEGVVMASAPGFASGAQPFVAELGQVTEVNLTLHAGTRVVGCVRTADGAPVRDARVLRGAGARPLVTGRDGAFSLDVSPGHVTVEAQHARLGVARAELDLATGETATLDLILDELLVVAGRVVDARGDPQAGLWVTAFERTPLPVVPTDADGRFRLIGCAPGPVRVEVRADEPFRGLPLATTEAEAGQPVPDLVVTRPTAFLRLRVVRSDPELPCQIEVRELALGRSDYLMVGASGHARVGPLPAGRYLVRHAYLSDPPRFLYGLDLGPIDLRAGEERDLGTHVLATPNALHLVLRRTDGAAVRAQRVTLTPQTGNERAFTAHFDEGGRLWPRSFPPGRYRVHVDAGLECAAGDVDVEIAPAQTTEARLELAPLRTCRLRLASPVQPSADGELRDEKGSVTPLRFWLGRAETGLPRGRYTLVVGGRTRTTFAVGAVEGRALVVDVPPP